ncbi:hypothetical protein AQUCO_10800024v1 [Aquilegia coerulea]|uniref:Uncharacterized protein n=1 Tax=Aquilegia coerulea TaxID=218851 RepID=A0A2G5C3C3_AQUCA|nr:hypothetical protein AQUCO_10800024v1 [Aquilegia coerulea]
MGSGKNRERREERESGEVLGVKKTSTFKNPNNKIPLGIDRAKMKKTEKDTTTKITTVSSCLPASDQLIFFLDRFQSATGIKISSLELEPIKDTSVLELSQELDQDAEALNKHMKASFGKSWKESLYEGQPLDGKVDPGSPALLVISISALRSLELLRGLRPLTRECRAAKLFAKHMKVEDQVSMLKSRVNIASGTPSRLTCINVWRLSSVIKIDSGLRS